MRQKPDPGSSAEQEAIPREQPSKKEGDKMDVGSSPTGGAGDPQTTPLEPEKQGGIGGP